VLADGITFSGRIVDDSDRPLKEAEIGAYSTDGIERAVGSDRSREDGSFEIRGMRPGAYHVFVVDDDGATQFDDIHPENGPVTLRLAHRKKD
jgi:protocatechuate 3,4-dioxygenase beta subunit